MRFIWPAHEINPRRSRRADKSLFRTPLGVSVEIAQSPPFLFYRGVVRPGNGDRPSLCSGQAWTLPAWPPTRMDNHRRSAILFLQGGRYEAGSGGTVGTLQTDYGYTGQRKTETIKLLDYGAR